MSPTVTVPWGSWYEDTTLKLDFPPDFDVELCTIRDGVALRPDEIQAGVRSPINSKSLREMAEGAKSAVIAVDDITRPTPAAEVLPFILEELSSISQQNIKILISLGAHRPMVRQELEKKLGPEIVATLDVEQHHPHENLADLGTSSRGTPISINRNFLEADLKLSVGAVMPHPYMGFSGGTKLVVPGLAGMETLRSNHSAAITGISGGLGDPDVEARKDIEEIGLKAGLKFTCNVVVNSRREIAGLFCGDPVDSHRAAARFCQEIYETSVQNAPFDVLLLNAYPKDTELLQAGNVFNCYRMGSSPLVKENGTVLILTCCSTGRGYHSLHGKDMQLYRTPGEKKYLNGRELLVFSPNINQMDFQVSFWDRYSFCTTWTEVLEHLDRKHNHSKLVGVFPVAPLQMPQ